MQLLNKKFFLYFCLLISLVFFSNISVIDKNYLNNFIRDSSAKYFFNENFKTLKFYPPLDYSWAINGDFYIAHALGGSVSKESNTLKAMEYSVSSGFRFLEIDIWLDESNILRCHHGPDQPFKFKYGDCHYQAVVDFLKNKDVYLIIDIKTDFKKTATLLIETSKRVNFKNFILQLYQPSDVNWFYENFQKQDLLGPIFTTYKMISSQERVASYINNTSIKALAMHESKFTNNIIGLPEIILVFPVSNCEQANLLKANNVDFVYVPNNLFKTDFDCAR